MAEFICDLEKDFMFFVFGASFGSGSYYWVGEGGNMNKEGKNIDVTTTESTIRKRVRSNGGTV